jgi:N-succinyldiaminopimelate aminotransferase
VLPSQGTYFVCADVAALGHADAQELALRLPREAGVVAIPVSAFVADPHGETRSLLRFAFCKRDAVLDEAIERLVRWSAAG